MKKALNKSEAVSKIKEGYIEEIKFIFGTDNIPEKEKSRFSFLGDKNITLCICSYTWHKRTWYIFFAHKTPSDDIKLEFYDFSVETNNYDFENITLNQRIEWLINKNLLNIRQENIIWNSVNNGIFIQESNLMEFGSNWAKNEYEQTNKILQKNTKVERFPVINQHFFVDRYHFDDMLKSINDDQFSDEFNQCLFAYNHEKWFLCATGLGSCLEHLMYIIIANYGDFKNLGKKPTFKDYITKFKQPPISISSRQATFISLLFMARNSVDHHNTGNTHKNICDLLLDGISDIYNDYYPDSILAKKGD